MVTELARGTSSDAALADSPDLLTGEQSATVTELYPRVDPLNLTRLDWLYLPDSQKGSPLVDLRMRSFDQVSHAKVIELFPEGFAYQISPIEERVFASASRVKNSIDGEVSDNDRGILSAHLHLEDGSVDDTIIALQDFGDLQRAGAFWPTQHSVGGYELNRLIAYEIEREVQRLQKREEIRLSGLEGMSSQLQRAGIPMIESDEAELDRLRAVVEERNAGIQALNEQARIGRYRNTWEVLQAQTGHQRIH